jgi:hypothetical protein
MRNPSEHIDDSFEYKIMRWKGTQKRLALRILCYKHGCDDDTPPPDRAGALIARTAGEASWMPHAPR